MLLAKEFQLALTTNIVGLFFVRFSSKKQFLYSFISFFPFFVVRKKENPTVTFVECVEKKTKQQLDIINCSVVAAGCPGRGMTNNDQGDQKEYKNSRQKTKQK